MKDGHKKLEGEIASQLIASFQTEEVKQLIVDTKAASDDDTGTFEVVITTENIDRYGEVIKLDGWDLSHFRANPIVLWGHDHGQPIGMATSVEVIEGKMIAKGKFAPTPKAQEIRTLYDAGIIKATSVGFIVKEQEGNLITKAELIEFSFVSVPANPFALTLAMEKGFAINDLVTKGMMFVEKEAEQVEEDQAEEPAPVEPEPEVEPEQSERNFSTKQLAPVIDSLRSALVALEALGVKAEEPEGDDAPAETEETEDEEALRTFNEGRKLLQLASTVIGDVLAESRRAIEARKSAE